ncbi:hypothetical protein P7C73_g5281, partial [Tremellales sp. Uapishka_1]
MTSLCDYHERSDSPTPSVQSSSPEAIARAHLFASRGPAYFAPSCSHVVRALWHAGGGEILDSSDPSSLAASYFFAAKNDELLPNLVRRAIVVFHYSWIADSWIAGERLTPSIGDYILEQEEEIIWTGGSKKRSSYPTQSADTPCSGYPTTPKTVTQHREYRRSPSVSSSSSTDSISPFGEHVQLLPIPHPSLINHIPPLTPYDIWEIHELRRHSGGEGIPVRHPNGKGWVLVKEKDDAECTEE